MSQITDDDNVEFRGGTLELNGDLNISRDSSNLEDSEDTEPVAKLVLTPNTQLVKLDTTRTNKESPAVLTGVDTLSTMTTSSPSTGDHSEAFNFLGNGENAVVSHVDFPFSAENIRNFFTYRSGMLENAVKDCISGLIFPDSDGEVIGSWLLTEISLWDHEKERLVILTNKVLIHIKYDFIALRKLDFKRVPLTQIDTIVTGDLVYPPASLVPDRNVRGVRVMWNNGQPLPFVKKWNPFTQDIPFLTYTSHPMFWHKGAEDGPDRRYDSNDLAHVLTEAVENERNTGNGSPCKIFHSPIVLQNYVGVTSLVHNKSSLGFFKVRGKFSF